MPRPLPIGSRRSLVASALALPFLLGAASAPSSALDTHFGHDGVVITPTAPGAGGDYQNGLAVQPDGKILVGGESDMGSAAGGAQWRITRYLRSGKLDKTFGSHGTVLMSMSKVGEFDERLVSLAVQRDGKIVAGGFLMTGPDSQDSALARFNSDGTLDDSFGDGGKVVTDVATEPAHDFINQVVLDHRGRIVVGGGCVHTFVARYLRNGRLDASFNRRGPRPGIAITEIAPAESNSEILGMTIDRRGRIVGSGYSTVLDNGSPEVSSAVVRFLPNGTLDPAFNSHGARPGTVVTKVAPDGNWDVAFRVAVDHRGRLVTAGDAYVGVDNAYDIAVSRYTARGKLDRSFGIGGVVLTNAGPGASDDDAQGLVVLPGGAIVVGGSAAPTAFTFDSDFMVARFRPDGRLDRHFGDRGVVITPTGAGNADDEIFAMARQGRSKVVASGECDQPATGRDVCVVAYNLVKHPVRH